MSGNRKWVNSPKLAGILGAITAAVTILTVGQTQRHGVPVQSYHSEMEPAYCTILVYMNGSDLENKHGAASDDIREMQVVLEEMGDETGINVVVEAGGSRKWHLNEITNERYCRFRLSNRGITQMEGMERRNMGDSRTLADFINYGTQVYPAEHYGLVLWNHGSGPIGGYGNDQNYEGDSLTLAELKDALDRSAMRDHKFDFVAFDACLMGGIELVSCLSGRSDYLIASPELEPKEGYDYRWLWALADQPSKPGKPVGAAMLAYYRQYYQAKEFPVTLSLMDLEKYEEFHRLFHAFLSQLSPEQQSALFQLLGRERTKMQTFGSRAFGQFSEIVDLRDLLAAFQKLPGEPPPLDELLQAMDDLVAGKVAERYTQPLSGLTIYLPSGSNNSLGKHIGIYNSIGFCSAYQNLVDGYGRFLLGNESLDWDAISASPNGRIEVEVSPEDIPAISNAYLAIFAYTGEAQQYYLLSTESKVTIDVDGKISATPKTKYIGMGGQIFCLIEIKGTKFYSEYIAPILYNGELCTMRIDVDGSNPSGEIVSITPAGTSDMASKQQYKLTIGDRITPLYPIERMEDVKSDSEETLSIASYYHGSELVIETREMMSLKQIPLSSKEYFYGFLLVDDRQKLHYTEFVAK